VLLLLFAAHAWSTSPGPCFNILDYGAHRDGSASSTEAIHSAIQAAQAAGGGTVYVPAGNYLTGPIELVSNLVLQVEAGATLRFPAARLPFTKGRVQGIECLTPVPLIGGQNLQNVTMDNVSRPISVTQLYQMQGETPAGPEPVSPRTPVFRDIAISHVTISRASGLIDFSWNPISTTASSGEGPRPILIDIAGLPEMPIVGLRLSDVIASGKAGLRASHTLGLELHNVQVNADSGPAFFVRDSQELELDGVTTRHPLPDAPVIRLERSPGAVVRASRAFTGTGTFLSVAPGEMKTIVLEGNGLTNARNPTEETDGKSE
jgi:hypothetical protein